MARSDSPILDLETLPEDVRDAVHAALEGSDIKVIRGERELGTLTFRSSVLEGEVMPSAGWAEEEITLPDGVTVVATAMKLSDSARRRLSDEFGSDYIVLDLHEAPPTANVLLIHPVSPQLLGTLRTQFPDARIIVTEIEDEELGVRYTGSVSRLLDAGASAYLPPQSVASIADNVHAYLTRETAPAIEAMHREHPQIEQ